MNSHKIGAKDVLQWLALHSTKARLEECLFQQELAERDEEVIGLTEGNDQLIRKGDEKDQVTDLAIPPISWEVSSFEAQDPLIEVNLGKIDESRQTKINGLLSQGELDQLVQLITRYKDCFAWDYHEMLGLSRELVEHQLSIKE